MQQLKINININLKQKTIMRELKIPNFTARLNFILTTVSIAFFIKYIQLFLTDSITVLNTTLLVLYLYVFYVCIVYFVKLFKGTLTDGEKRSSISIEITLDEKVFTITDKTWYYIFSPIFVIGTFSILYLPMKNEYYFDLFLTFYIVVNAVKDIYYNYKK